MREAFLVLAALVATACASAPAPSAPEYAAETLAPGRYRVTYISKTGTSAAVMKARALASAAQLTLDKGDEWFEIAAEIGGPDRHALIIVTGSGEPLAGGASKTYDARETLKARPN